MRIFLAFSALSVSILSCPLKAQVDRGGLEDVDVLTALVQPSADAGFNYPYVLKLPTVPARDAPIRIIVESNNSGLPTDDFDTHLKAARRATEQGVGAYAANRLALPLLVPVFPRPGSNSLIYTHALDSDSLDIRSGPMRRLDLPLVAMIDDAIERLRAAGVEVEEQVLMVGFSASATLANRFSMIHPNRVAALAIGGFNAVLMLPVESFDGVELPYPLGLADYEARFGRPFDRDAWSAIPQFAFMGESDTNDAVEFDDAYSVQQRLIIHRVMGEAMQDRWQFVQDVYRDSGATFLAATYSGVGHGTNGSINTAISNYLNERNVE